MRKRLIFYPLIVFVFLNISGCAAAFLVGVAAGGVGVYAVSKDTIQGEIDRSYDSLWNAALKVSKIRGTIKQENSVRGYIELDTDASHVWIRLVRLSRATTRVRISARKFHLPNLTLAQDIFVKIIEEAR